MLWPRSSRPCRVTRMSALGSIMTFGWILLGGMLLPSVKSVRIVPLPNIEISFVCRNKRHSYYYYYESMDYVRELTGYYMDLFPSALDVAIDTESTTSRVSFFSAKNDTNIVLSFQPDDETQALDFTRIDLSSHGGDLQISDSTFMLFHKNNVMIENLVTKEGLFMYFEATCEDELVVLDAEISPSSENSSAGTTNLSWAIPLCLFFFFLGASILFLNKNVLSSWWCRETTPAGTIEQRQSSPPEEINVDQETRKKKDPSKASFEHTVFNMVNALMGIGLLVIPYAIAQSGLILGCLILLGAFAVTWKTSILLGRLFNGDPRPLAVLVSNGAGSRNEIEQAVAWQEEGLSFSAQQESEQPQRLVDPIKSFQDLARVAFGNIAGVTFSCLFYVQLFIGVVWHIVSMADNIHALFPSTSTQSAMIDVGLIAWFTATMLRTARYVSYLSVVGVFATMYLAGSIPATFFVEGNLTQEIAASLHPQLPPPPYFAWWNTKGFVETLGIVMLGCFLGQGVLPSVYHSMQRPQDYQAAVNWAYTISIVVYAAVGLCGYFMFGSFVHTQVTLSIQLYSSFALAKGVQSSLLIASAFSRLVLENFPLVRFLEATVAPYLFSRGRTPSMTVLCATSVAIQVGVLTLAIVVASYWQQSSILRLGVATTGFVCIAVSSIVFPAAAFLKLFEVQLGKMEKVVCQVIVLAGVAMAVVGISYSVMQHGNSSNRRLNG